MRIEQDIKLDYQDVLFKPKRSYFSNKKVLDAYKLFLNHNQIKEILALEDDNLLFSKLINK